MAVWTACVTTKLSIGGSPRSRMRARCSCVRSKGRRGWTFGFMANRRIGGGWEGAVYFSVRNFGVSVTCFAPLAVQAGELFKAGPSPFLPLLQISSEI